MALRSAPTELEARTTTLSAIPLQAWDDLLARTAAATPFARWTFHRAWWDAYGSTAHEQYVVCVPKGAGPVPHSAEIKAIVPLMHRHAVEPEDLATRTILRQHAPTGTSLPAETKAVFFGASYHADYATVLASPDDLEAACDAVATTLASPSPDPEHGSQPWDALDLRRLRESDPALAALEASLGKLGRIHDWSVIREVEDVCPVVTIRADDWDGYLATLDSKDRHEIRRKLRRAAAIGNLSVEVASPTRDAVDAFIRLHQLRFGENGLFPSTAGGESSRHFMHRLAELERNAPDGGQLHIALVRCGDKLIFAAAAFDDGTTCYLYNAGMDPAAADLSPGVTGTAEYLRNRIAAGRRRFDFLRGDEPYKYEWGAVDERVERLLILRKAAAPETAR